MNYATERVFNWELFMNIRGAREIFDFKADRNIMLEENSETLFR